MRAARLFTVVAAIVATTLVVNCSKKASSPVSPGDQPACSVSASTLDFGSVAVGGSADRSFTISNAGGGTLSGTASTASANYAVIGGASYSLGAGEQASVTVRFSPSSGGSIAGTVTLTGTGCGSVSCTGSAVPSGPVCQIAPGFLSFSTIAGACASLDRSFTISNAGSGTLSGTVSSHCAAFSIIGNPAYSLGPGQRDTITVRFAPEGYGDFSCWISTGCDSLFCGGTIARHDICGVVSPDVLDFGTVYVGQTVTMGSTLTAGSMPFSLIWYSEGNPNFDPPSGVLVKANDSFSCEVDFTPQSAGQHEAWFAGQCRPDFGGDGDYHPFACLTARGTAVAAPGTPTCQISTTNLNFGTVSVGSSADRTFTVTNIGGGVLNGTVQPSGCPEFMVQQEPRVSLGPGQSKTYTIRFTPTAHGTTVTCYAFPFDPNCAVVTLTGQGQ